MAIALRSNDFGHFRIERGDRQVWALRAHCQECGKSDDLVLGGGKSTLTQDFAERGFRNRHWYLGKDRSSDRCPTCIDNEIAQRKAAQEKALAELPPPDLSAHDPVPKLPDDATPRIRLKKPIDWLPSQDEINEFLKDRHRAVGSDPKARRSGQIWYPAITRGGENFIRSVIETRVARNHAGLFTYERDWNDLRTAEVIDKLYPSMHCSRDMVRQVRTLFFGPSMVGRTRTKPDAPAEQPVEAVQAPTDTPVAQTEPKPVSAPEKPPAVEPVGRPADTLEKDLIFLFEEFEKLKANRGWNVVMGRIEALEARVARIGQPAKALEDYSIAELLEEIGRRTSQAQAEAEAPPAKPLPPAPVAPPPIEPPAASARPSRAPTGPEIVFATIANGRRKFRDCADAMAAAGLSRNGAGALLAKMLKRGQLVQDKNLNYWRPNEQPRIVPARN